MGAGHGEWEPAVRVLIVEDEAIVAEHMAWVLEDAGHDVAGCACDAAEAVRLAARGGVEVALVDVNLMDGPTGPQVGEILARSFGINVVFVTANPRQLGLGVPGTMGVLEKPADEDALVGLVDFAGAGMPPPRGFQPFSERVSRPH